MGGAGTSYRMIDPHHFRPLKPPEPTRPGAFRAGGGGPSASLRGKPDNGTCPAMPGAAGPGNGAAHKRRRRKHFLVTFG